MIRVFLFLALAGCVRAIVPSDLSGLQLDIDPELESGADGSTKATLTDQSGNARTLTAVGTNGTIEFAECNGKKIIKKTAAQGYYSLAGDYSVTDFTVVAVMRELSDAAVNLCGNAAGTTRIYTDRTTDGDYFRTDFATGSDSVTRGLRSATAWGAYMIQQDGGTCRMYDAGEICPQLFGTGSRANDTMTFRRFLGIAAGDNDCEIARLLVYDRALTQTECRQLGDYIFTQYAISPKTLFVAEGNSYVPDTTGRGALTVSILANHKDDIEVFNVGLSGASIADMQTDYATQVGPLYAARRPFNFVGAYEFTNTLTGLANLAATEAAYWTYCDTCRADGFKVIAVTPTAWHGGVPATVEAGYQALWPLMRADWTTHADALADPAILAVFDDDDDTADTTYYNADRLHLVAAGSALVADLVEEKVEALMAASSSTLNATTLNVTNLVGP